jgi:dTDP-4-dehydrorhamnose reductase
MPGWLILGGNGRLGGAFRALAPAGSTAPRSAQLNLTDSDALARAIDEQEPTWVLNCAAQTDVDAADRDARLADELNGLAPGRLARRCARAGVPLLHISTDYVFSGCDDGLLDEDRPLDPINRYGQSKARGEGLVLDSGTEALVARVQWLFGGGSGDFVRFVRGRGRAGQTVPVVTGQVGTPSYTPDLAAWMVALERAGARGVVHVANAGEVSRWDQAGAILAAIGSDARREPTSWQALGKSSPRPRRSVLSTAKMEAYVAGLDSAEQQVVDRHGLALDFRCADGAARGWQAAQADYLRRMAEEERR